MPGPTTRRLFLSAASKEFGSHRALLAQDLRRAGVDVETQELWGTRGATTFDKLDQYIQQCDAVIHLVGDLTGDTAPTLALQDWLKTHADLREKVPVLKSLSDTDLEQLSYTQWEAYLAVYYGRRLHIYRPGATAARDYNRLNEDGTERPKPTLEQIARQQAHFQRIRDLGRDRDVFLSDERLSSFVLADLSDILPPRESDAVTVPSKLSHAARRLVGREAALMRLDEAWNNSHCNVVVIRAWGGTGKTALVSEWQAELAAKNWRGAKWYFDWTFYSQGTRSDDQPDKSASADFFITEALMFFGDPNPTAGSSWDRGARLAKLVTRKRGLLVLDGVEPLQHPPGPMAGQLTDPGLTALLRGLAGQNAGLCVVTTREPIPDLDNYYEKTAQDWPLEQLSDEAGADLLFSLGVTRAGHKTIAPTHAHRDPDLLKASQEVTGHALTLWLMGKYLHLALDGDILQRDVFRLSEADPEFQNDGSKPYGHAFKVIAAYERWFLDDSPTANRNSTEQLACRRQLAVLRLLGLFNRAADPGCLRALRQPPVIDGLTNELVGLSDQNWTITIARLEELGLVKREPAGRAFALDAHPLLREYFAWRLRGTNSPVVAASAVLATGPVDTTAWRESHGRLFKHLCESTHEGNQPTLADLQPLYQAIAHGCQAGLQQEVCEEVLNDRIRQRGKNYAMERLGAFGSELGAVACFFETPWNRVSAELSKSAQAWLLGSAAYCLHALGRLTEGLEPMRADLELQANTEGWTNAAIVASNLSDLELTLGEVAAAERDAAQSATYADRSGDAWQRMACRATHAGTLQHTGRCGEAETLFHEAEQMQQEMQPAYPLLYSFQGFQYCDLLLTESERAAWQTILGRARLLQSCSQTPNSTEERLGRSLVLPGCIAGCRAVSRRAAQTLKWAEMHQGSLLTLALDHLTLGRAGLYTAILESGPHSPLCGQAADMLRTEDCAGHIDAAVTGLRRAGQQQYLPLGLLTRAWLRCLEGKQTGAESAREDLDEAWEIAERGSMKLYLADIHLYRARLFGRPAVGESGSVGRPATAYPWDSPQADLAAARQLIEQCGYGLRLEELADAEAALLQQPATP